MFSHISVVYFVSCLLYLYQDVLDIFQLLQTFAAKWKFLISTSAGDRCFACVYVLNVASTQFNLFKDTD